jgi:hypothetical protein
MRSLSGSNQKTTEQLTSYIECMLLTPNPPEDFVERLSKENFEQVQAYIDRKMTATWFSEIEPQTKNKEVITSELIYYWLTVYHIPFECETWHLNRLFTLDPDCQSQATEAEEDESFRNCSSQP